MNATVWLDGRVGGALPGRKVLTLVAAILAGGSHIDHANVLRAGATQAVLGFRVMAPSTLGTFLRAFTFGHVRQLEDRVIAETIRRAWQLGRRPRQRAAGHRHGLHDLRGPRPRPSRARPMATPASWAITRCSPVGLIPARCCTPGCARARLSGAQAVRGELVARVRRAGATGAVCLRADGGFWSHELIGTLTRLGLGYSITVRINKTIRATIEAIDPDAWTPIVYPDGGEAAVAETTYVTGRGRKRRSYRLVVCRSRLTDPAQLALWPDWRYHAFVTSSTTDAVTADRFHRDHARVELVIRDLKEGAGMEHCPSGWFFANAAWLACAVLAHNLFRWTAQLGGIRHLDELTIARTPRTQLIAVPASSTTPAPAGGAAHSTGPGRTPSPHPPARPTTGAQLDQHPRAGAPQPNTQRRQPNRARITGSTRPGTARTRISDHTPPHRPQPPKPIGVSRLRVWGSSRSPPPHGSTSPRRTPLRHSDSRKDLPRKG